jgi:autotransporter-associated beta strand protein
MKISSPVLRSAIRLASSFTFAAAALWLAGGLAAPARATILTYTNASAGAWATAVNWSPNTSWASGSWKTNAVNAGLRLNFGNSTAYTANALYTSAEGTTTIDVSTGTETRALIIGNGSGNKANLTISGGTLVAVQNSTNTPVIVGTPGNQGAMTANLILSGGNLLVTNGASQSAMSVLFRGSSSARATVTVTNGSLLAVDQINIGDPTQNTNVQFIAGAGGTINLGGSGTAGTIHLRSVVNGAPSFVMATNNFDGGVLRVSGNEQNSSPLLGTNLVNNILAGGLTVDSQSYSARVLSPLLNGVAGTDGGLTKLGSGTVTLYSSCTYNGNTTIGAGALALASSMTLASSSVRVAPGGTLGFNVSNSMISLPAVSLTNAAVAFNYGAFSGYSSAVAYVTNLTLSGTVIVNVSGTAVPATSLTLLAYGAKSGGGSFQLGSLPAGAAGSLVDTGSALMLNVTTASIQNLTWTGASGDSTWQVAGQPNWSPAGAVYLEYANGAGDIVTFDDTFGGGSVTIAGLVKPSSVTVNDSASYYTFVGSGSIGGAASLAKTGTSTLDILNSNCFSGVVTVTGGSLFVDNPYALGSTNGGTIVSGTGTVELGLSGGVTVAGETVAISGAGVGGVLGVLRGAAGGGVNEWAGPVVVAAQSARVGTEVGGNLTLSGNITDNGANYELFIRTGASGTVTITGSSNSFGATRFYGDSSATGMLKLGANNAISTNLLNMGPGYLDLNGFSQTVSGVSDVSGAGVILNNGGTASKLVFNVPAGTNTTASAILDGASQIRVEKGGSGRQTLRGVNNYTGPTTVKAGELDVVLPMSSSALTLADSTAMMITPSGASWSPSVMNATNASLTFSLGNLSSAPATPLTPGTLNLSGSIVIHVAAINLPLGQITLLSYGGKTGSGTFRLGSLPANVQAVLVDTGSSVVLTVSFAPQALTWSGAATGSWNLTGTADWSGGTGYYQEYTNGLGDLVTFDDSASVFAPAVADSVRPFSMTISNNLNAYTIGGAGRIGGTNGLIKNGTNVAALTSSNSYTGTTLVNAGTLNFTNGALGSAGNVVLNGSSTSVLQWAAGATEDLSSRLRIGGGNSSASTALFATLDVGTNVVVFNTDLSQSDTGGMISNVVQKVGAGTLRLAGGTTTLSSVLRVNAGTFEVTTNGTLNLNGGTGIANAALVSDNSAILVSGGAVNVADRVALATAGGSTSSLTVNAGALVSDSGSTQSDRGLRLAGGSGSSKDTNVAIVSLNGGTLTVARIYPGSGSNNTSVVNLNGGVLRASDNPVGTNFMSGLSHAYVNGGGAILDCGGSNLTMDQPLENDGVAVTDGGLVKLGGGQLTLTGTNTYTGVTVVSNGMLVVNGVLGTNAVIVKAGGLGGAGTIGGTVAIPAGARFSPGATAALGEVLTLRGALSLGGTTTIQIGRAASVAASDSVSAASVTYGGALVVTNADSSSLAAGDVFTLFSVTGSKAGNFSSVQVVPASLGLTAAFDPATGLLTLSSAAPPKIQCTQVGNALQLSWTGSGRLQVQTNAVGQGLGSKWVDFPGGASGPVTVPLDASVGSMFFRVAQ